VWQKQAGCLLSNRDYRVFIETDGSYIDLRSDDVRNLEWPIANFCALSKT